jgi:UrcA family protein
MIKEALAAGLFLTAVGVTGPARATSATSANATESGPSSVTVRYHESQLATSRGAHLLYARIDRAAQEVCDDTGEFEFRASFAQCERSAIADAVAEVDDNQLTAVYNEHFPKYPLAEATSLQLIPAIIVIVG